MNIAIYWKLEILALSFGNKCERKIYILFFTLLFETKEDIFSSKATNTFLVYLLCLQKKPGVLLVTHWALTDMNDETPEGSAGENAVQ